jgi:hypothetical protein
MRVSIKLKFGTGSRVPETFQGCSGGGIWQGLLKEDQNQFTIKELLLSGVAFYENQLDNVGMEIECHGIKSIYDKVVTALAE